MAPRKTSQRGRALSAFIVVMLVLSLLGGVVYFASNDNYRHYRLSQRENHLVIERGRRLPVGFAPFTPDTSALQRAYAPIELPQQADLPPEEVFDDRADLDRALFTLLAGFARTRLDSADEAEFARAGLYIERASLLPGLSEEQRQELRGLRADLSYNAGRRLVRESIQKLEAARAAFRASEELGTTRPTNAGDWVLEIDRRFSMLKELGGAAPPKPASLPNQEPTLPASKEPNAPQSEQSN